MQLDPDTLTLGELEEIENVTGQPVSTVLNQLSTGNWSASTITALVYVARRRHNPDYTLDDARSERIADLDLDTAPTPKVPSGSGSPP